MNDYVELHCHTNYSMLDGASHPEDLLARARELGMDSLAITDHDGLYGAVRFWQAGIQQGVRPIIGAELTLEGSHHITLLARDRQGYSNLCRLATAAHAGTRGWEGEGLRVKGEGSVGKGLVPFRNEAYVNIAAGDKPLPYAVEGRQHCRLGPAPHSQLDGRTPSPSPLTLRPSPSPLPPTLSSSLLSELSAGLIGLSGCRQGEIARHLLAGQRRRARAAAERYARIFGDGNFWIELQRHLLPEDDWLCDELADLAARLGLGCVATNDVHYARQEDRPLQDILACIKNRTSLDAAGALLRPNSEFHLKSAGEMASLFKGHPGAVANTRVVAGRCDVDLNFKGYRFPGFQPPRGESSFSYLHRLCNEGARERYQPITPAVSRQLAHELDVIYKTGLAEYFLIVWDIMRYAREQGIPGQGRGSAADSLVAYVLGITKVDPIRHNLLFERFLSEEMTGMPDIDIDFSTNHREKVIQYVYQKYGHDHTAMVCNVVCYRARNALREVGKAMGLPLEMLDRFAKAVNRHSPSHLEEELTTLAAFEGLEGFAGEGPWRQLLEFCRQIEGFPRHLSIHVGGMLITSTPLVEIAPIQPSAMPGRMVVQFNKDDVEDMGLIKMDLLGLRTLSVVHDALEMIRQGLGVDLDLDRIPLDDPAVYDMLCRADNIGVFQVESRAQSQTLPKMKPRSIEDLIVEISIIRPGPLQGNMVHPYLRRRAGTEEVVYLHPSLEPVLKETLGVVLFQEQVIRVASAVAGFSAGEGDMFRRAMNRHRSGAEMERIRVRFMEGAVANGLEEATAAEIFRQLSGFAAYGFCKSHAAAFARTAYDTAYLKLYYAPELYAAILNNQPMGFYSPEVVVGDARRHGIRILPVDVNLSRAKCTVEKRGGGGKGGEGEGRGELITHHSSLIARGGRDIRMGLSYVHGLGDAALEALDRERARGPFRSLADLLRRTILPREAVENLISVGAMDCFGRPRREMLWEAGGRAPSYAASGASPDAFSADDKDSSGTSPDATPEVTRRPKPAATDSSSFSPSRPSPPFSPLLPALPAPALPIPTPYEETAAQYSLMGLSTGRHAVELFRDLLEEAGAVTCGAVSALPRNLVVRMGGLVVTEQAPPTAKGHVFLTLEDETGLANVILRPGMYPRFRRVLQTNQIVLVEGLIQRQDGITNLMARRISPLSQATVLAAERSKRPHRR